MCGGGLILTESIVGLAFLRARIVLEPNSTLAGTSGYRIESSAPLRQPERLEPALAILGCMQAR